MRDRDRQTESETEKQGDRDRDRDREKEMTFGNLFSSPVTQVLFLKLTCIIEQSIYCLNVSVCLFYFKG